MGFHRQGMPQALNRAELADIITRFVAEEVAFENRVSDPFLIAHGCTNPAGHDFIASCGAVVCCHCSVVAWQ